MATVRQIEHDALLHAAQIVEAYAEERLEAMPRGMVHPSQDIWAALMVAAQRVREAAAVYESERDVNVSAITEQDVNDHAGNFTMPGEKVIAEITVHDYGFGFRLLGQDGIEYASGNGPSIGSALDMLCEYAMAEWANVTNLVTLHGDTCDCDDCCRAAILDIGKRILKVRQQPSISDSVADSQEPAYNGQWHRGLYGGDDDAA